MHVHVLIHLLHVYVNLYRLHIEVPWSLFFYVIPYQVPHQVPLHQPVEEAQAIYQALPVCMIFTTIGEIYT